MLALVASIHSLNTALDEEDVGGRDKPDHDAGGIASGCYRKNGLFSRSSPSVLAGPWPGRNWTSSPSGSSFVLIPEISASWSP